MSAVETFGSRLGAAILQRGRLCVGIDPHSYLLEQWGLADTAAGAREFSLRVLDAAAGHAAAVKPQIAFYERFGAAGYTVLEEVLVAAKQRELLSIADVKRGDVGTSVQAYGDAWLRPGSPLESDAMTISVFQGFGSIVHPLQYTIDSGKGLFLLAATSNPEARDIQRARVGPEGVTVAAHIVNEAQGWNERNRAVHPTEQGDIGSVGVVLGATLDLEEYGVSIAAQRKPALPVLAPGFGHQGAALSDAVRLFGSLTRATLVSESRSVLSAGPGAVASAVRERAELVKREVAL
ncbi:orotidine-5'-phosphate decarboxylase [Klugiella xanthotipulae]|uniref:Orotidine-5'-phosphate decarboxylase n=1 Tax=Klugiella xanthotipulae TaxID=244735 RepID=A0A543HSI4_9MICO|nr:orotidine-5'-phosphate decarboxylase [Klugiella xanthotipulae]TQM61224.1 orotidine-5'-phosphate decarboxylase [Klugiella xanthotipulae]